MSIAPQVFHHVPKPISFVEFFEAVRAATPRRYPHAKQILPRRIGLCVSGGADSMALAFLFDRLRARDAFMRVADNSIAIKPAAFVVDHKLRPESTDEAKAVVKMLAGRFTNLDARYMAIPWHRYIRLPVGVHPATLPGIEGLARRFRYRRIANEAAAMNVISLFTAHHEDDQYETVLMRLLNGHGVRGLGGMKMSANVPECDDMHGVHESGFIDDQLSSTPSIVLHPPRRYWRYTKEDLLYELDSETYMSEVRSGGSPDGAAAYLARRYGRDVPMRRHAQMLPPPIETEEGGMAMYRPLLEFSKDRLVATCEANNVPWVEDKTNHDRTYTLRNAVRYMVKHHELPVALRKDSVLQLSRRCVEKTKTQDDEAERWASRMVIHEFEPLVGTLVATMPDMAVRRSKRRSLYSRTRRELRMQHRRAIAALLVRRLILFVTPELNLPQLSGLQSCVARLFPALALPAERAKLEPTPKAFNQASVLFIPIHKSGVTSPTSQKWYLTRQPYPSNKPLPRKSWFFQRGEDNFIYLTDPSADPPEPEPLAMRRGVVVKSTESTEADAEGDIPPETQAAPSKGWTPWRHWEMYDGRFWFRSRGHYCGTVRVAPLSEEHIKPFRDGLDDAGRARLADLLRRHAPGKVRYTLPALYAVRTPPPWVVSKENEDSWIEEAAALGWDETGSGRQLGPVGKMPMRRLDEQNRIDWWRGAATAETKLLGLPTLGVYLPGLENWIQCQVRYKKVDVDLLEKTAPRDEPSLVGSGRFRGLPRRRMERRRLLEERKRLEENEQRLEEELRQRSMAAFAQSMDSNFDVDLRYP